MMTTTRFLFRAVLPLVALGLLGTALAGEPRKGLEKGTQAPEFFMSPINQKAAGVKRVFLDKMVGDSAGADKKKLLLLSFFNIDCKPCRKELPFLQKLYERYREQGLGVLVINCDFKKDKVKQAVDYVIESGFTFPVLMDKYQALVRRYAIGKYPTMYILDGSGKIVDVRIGYNEEKMPFPLADVQRRLGVELEPIAPPPVAPEMKGKENKGKKQG